MSTEKSIAHRTEGMALISRNIERIINSVKRKQDKEYTASYLRDKLQKLNECWEKANQYHVELLVAVSETERETTKYFTEKTFEKMESAYDEIEEFLSERLSDMNERVKAINPNETLYSPATWNASTSNVKLPRIDLPKFTGDYHEWTSFRDVFTSIIHENPSITKVQKFQYLKSSLEGEARSLVSALSLTHENYDIAWRALTNRFQNKRMIVTSLISRLFVIKPVAGERVAELKTLRNEYSIVLDSLQSIDVTIKHWDPLIIFLLSQKLDRNLRQAWEETLSNSADLPLLSDLSNFLDNKIRTLETLDFKLTDTHCAKEITRRVSLNVVDKRRSDNVNRSCRYCDQNHTIYVCPTFTKLSPLQRQSAITCLQLELLINAQDNRVFEQSTMSNV